ncbi:MAG TPA: FAD-dependent oxidoreductase [Thermomicrobiales bacterium]|nr:FAD-dependent oxidoreductase [Thermomicrobiales bacterium]
MTSTIVVVGANIGGGRAVEALRKEGFDGDIVLVGAEPDLPYERPPLSKGYLTGEVADGEFSVATAEGYAEQRIETRLATKATTLDPAAKTVTLDDGTTLHYDTLLIATGASPRRLRIPGHELAGIHYLRTVADSRAIRDELANAERVAVVGMGFIGAEIAASARTLGKQVTTIEAIDLPLAPALGSEVAERIVGIHRAHGVEVLSGEMVAGFEGNGRVQQVVTKSGRAVPCDMVVVGIGVTPNTDWLAGSGIEIDNGILVDEYCRTSVPDVYAAGDVANWWSKRYGRRLRIEHFDNAGNQAVAAAKAMLGQDHPYDPVPYFWSDHYDISVQVAGMTQDHDQVVFRGAVESGSWSAFYLASGQLRAALAANRFKDFSAGRRMLRAGTPVTADQLADESVELKTFLT